METEMDRNLTIGVGKEITEKLDFIIVPLNHLHMAGFPCRGDEDIAEQAAGFTSAPMHIR